jgi:hypothetical protein
VRDPPETVRVVRQHLAKKLLAISLLCPLKKALHYNVVSDGVYLNNGLRKGLLILKHSRTAPLRATGFI